MLAQVWQAPTNGFRYVFLDEPLNNLDINYQQEFLHIAKSITNSKTIFIAIMHDINLALQYADELFFFKNGQLTASGVAKSLISEKLIEEVFNVKANVISNPLDGKPLVVFGKR